MKILEINNLNISYLARKKYSLFLKEEKKIIKNFSLEIEKGESIGIFGESGAGKSTLVKALLGLIKFDYGVKISGDIKWNFGNQNTENKSKIFYKSVQPVFQDPTSSLEPRYTIHEIINEPLKNLIALNKKERNERISEILEEAGINSKLVNRYPNEFSIGQKQRICIARAMAVKPEVLIADEPVSSLDVSIQSQILNLINHFRITNNLTLIFISHNQKILDKLCNRKIEIKKM